ncbi:MAG: hypothetical protein C0501_19920 [Isosphaera sp.]|nr:hypothetical protein [Isosphaera sp.]
MRPALACSLTAVGLFILVLGIGVKIEQRMAAPDPRPATEGLTETMITVVGGRERIEARIQEELTETRSIILSATVGFAAPLALQSPVLPATYILFWDDQLRTLFEAWKTEVESNSDWVMKHLLVVLAPLKRKHLSAAVLFSPGAGSRP